MSRTLTDRDRTGPQRRGGFLAACLLLLLVSPASGYVSVERNRPGLVDAFLGPPVSPESAYSMSVASRGLFPSPSDPVKQTGKVYGGDPYRILLHRTLAGQRYGLPVVLDLETFIDLRLKRDRQREFAHYLHKHTSQLAQREGGLLSISLPVKIPRGLSAITGEGTTQIEITGRRSITFSGRSDYTVGQVQTAANRQSKFPTITFDQQSQFKVHGQIGDRINIELEQNSESPEDLASSLRLSYKGPEDGVIQEIEAGNTNLALPGTRLVGFSQGRQGLFGIRGKATLGGLDVTMIASQDKGSANRKTFRGESQETSNDLRDYQYIKNTYFFMDELYRKAFQAQAQGQPALSPGDQVADESVEVYVNDFNSYNDIEKSAIPGIASAFSQQAGWADTVNTRGVSGGRERGQFHKLDRNEYQVYPNGYVILNQPLSDAWALAAAYRTQGGKKFGDVNFVARDSTSTAQLKLIKAQNQRPPTASSPNNYPTWRLMWKNVYSLGGRSVEKSGFSLRVKRDVPGQEPLDHQEGKSYLQILGLDRHGQTASSPPDNLVDFDEFVVDLARGELVFPYLEPFGAQDVGAPGLKNRVPEIYNEANEVTQRERSQYSIEIKSQSRQTQFNLGYGDVIDNSEQVRLNGRLLRRGQDYIVDYQTGALSFQPGVTTEVANPSASLDISWDSKSLFGFSATQKSLLGLRMEHKLGGGAGGEGQSLLGMTFLYSNQSSPSRRVRVGAEPSRSMVLDANARLEFKPQFLTDLVNALPLVEAHTPSALRVNAEVAGSFPNPNTRGAAYVDDFEGSSGSIPLSMFRAAWTPASEPTQDGGRTSLYPGKLTWYNPYERVRVTDIQPYRAESITAEQNVDDILVLKFSPRRGKYGSDRRIPRGYAPLWTEGTGLKSWAGIMSGIRGGLDLSRSKFLEIWVRGNRGKLHVDLGEVSEDLILPFTDAPNGELDTEDRPLAGSRIGDNILAPEEDTGLDRDPTSKARKPMANKEEQSAFKALFGSLLPVPEDPSGDDWIYESRSSNYERINGLEGNGLKDGDRAGIPDTEDINGNTVLDTRNDYWRYSVDLSRDREDGLRAEGTESDNSVRPWRLVRIPLREDTRRHREGGPDPNLATAVDFARVWVEHDDSTTVELYQIYATVTDWQEDAAPFFYKSDPLKVTSRNTSRDGFYQPPPGISLESDPANPSIKVPEGSLAFQFGDLFPNEPLSTTRIFPNGETYTDYSRMRMFVHGGNNDKNNPNNAGTFPDSGKGASPVELFLRFGPGTRDSLNYYEYRTPVYRGWDPLNEVDVDMALMSQLKGFLLDLRTAASRDSSTSVKVDTSLVPPGVADYQFRRQPAEVEAHVGRGAGRKTYIVRGNPAFAGIRTFTIGIRNVGTDPIRAGRGQNEIWVDELRVDNIRKKSAFSGTVDLDMQLSDFGHTQVSMAYQGGDFQDLRSRASGIARNSFSVSNTFNLERFFPTTWGLNIPISVSYDRSAQVPRIRRGSDIVLTVDQRRDESDIQSSVQANVSFRKQTAQQNPRLLSSILFDRVTARLSINTRNGQTGAVTQRNDASGKSVNGSVDYSLTPTKDRTVKPLGWMPFKSLKSVEFHYLPSTFHYSANLNQNVSNSRSFSAAGRDTTNVIVANSESFDMTEDYQAKISPFKSLSANYSMNIRRDLQGAFRPGGLQFGKEVGRTQSADFSLNMSQISWLSQSYNYTANYSESNDPRGQGYSPVGQGRRGRDANVSSQIGGRYNLNLPTLFRKLGGSRFRSYSAAKEGAEKRGKGFPILGWMGRMGGNLRPVSLQASRNKTANLYGLVGRPTVKYQLGISDSAEVQRTEVRGFTRIDAFGTTDRLSSDTGVNLPMGMSVNSRYEYSRDRRTGNSANSPAIHSVNTNFPTLTLSWNSFGQLPLVRRVFSSATAEASFDEKGSVRGEGGTGPKSVLQRSNEKNIKPYGLNFQLKNKIGMNVQQTTRRTFNVDFQPNDADTARAELGQTIQQGNNLSASLRYSFSPTSGLFKRFNLKSNVDMTLEFAQQGNVLKKTPAGSKEFAVQQDDSQWSAGISSSYRFNQNFTGQMRLRHENRRDNLRHQNHKVWEFSLTGEIVFN